MVAHHSWGYPAREDTDDPIIWRNRIERIERELDTLLCELTRYRPSWAEATQHTWVLKIFRQLGMRETNQGWCMHHPEVPWGFPSPIREGHLWTTSVWNWLWVVTHLGNHREQFPTVWCHIHDRALCDPRHPRDAYQFLVSDTECCRWIDRMTDSIENLYREEEIPDAWDTDSNPQSCTEENEEYETGYVTQEPTPDWVWALTDSESESLPSSLDTFVNDTFAIPPSTEWLP